MCAPESSDAAGAAATASGKTRSEADEKLLKAALDGEVAAIDTALSRGGSAKATDENGRLALHFIAAQGIQSLVDTLLQYGAPINQQDVLGLTPLHMAAGYKRPDTVRKLVDAGADVNLTNNNGQTALDIARALLDNAPDKKFLIMPNKDKPKLQEIVGLLRDAETKARS